MYGRPLSSTTGNTIILSKESLLPIFAAAVLANAKTQTQSNKALCCTLGVCKNLNKSGDVIPSSSADDL